MDNQQGGRVLYSHYPTNKIKTPLTRIRLKVLRKLKVQIKMSLTSLKSKAQVLNKTLLIKSPKRINLRQQLKTRRIHSQRNLCLKIQCKANQWASLKFLMLLRRLQLQQCRRHRHLSTLIRLQEQLNLIQPQQKRQKLRLLKHHKKQSRSIHKAPTLTQIQRHQLSKIPNSQRKKKKLHRHQHKKRNLNKSKSSKCNHFCP